jgi:soluble lytic murein transglycosylase
MYSNKIRKNIVLVSMAGLLLYGAVQVDNSISSTEKIRIKQHIKNNLTYGTKQVITKEKYKKINKIHKIIKENINTPIITKEIAKNVKGAVNKANIINTKENNKSTYRYLEIPLSHREQEWVFDLCKRNSIDPYLVFAIMKEESEFINLPPNECGCMGVLQPNLKTANGTLEWLKINDYKQYEEILVNFNLMDYYTNCHVAICRLHMLDVQGNELFMGLLKYGCGDGGAIKYIRNNGYVQPRYMKKWFFYQEQLRQYGKIVEEYGR